MREVLTLLFLASGLAVCCQNNLNVFSGNGELFVAYIDDKKINEIPQAGVIEKGIADDTVRLKILINDKQVIGETIYLLDKKKSVIGKEFSYRIDKNKEHYKLVFSSISDIKPLPEPIVPPKPVVDTSYKYKNNVLENYCELKNGKPVFFNNIPEGGCKQAMPASYMNYLAILMKKAQVDDDKFSIADNTVKNNCISTAQLNKILTYIPYELEKLKLLRTAYFNLSDKQSRSNLDSSFKMESSKKELASFFKNSEEYRLHTINTCTKPSDKETIKKFSESLSIYSTDNERFAVFKKQYKDHCYTSADIKQIISNYIHDREKLDSAKLLYFYCTDKENFSLLSDIFSYTTSFAELNDFVSKQKK